MSAGQKYANWKCGLKRRCKFKAIFTPLPRANKEGMGEKWNQSWQKNCYKEKDQPETTRGSSLVIRQRRKSRGREWERGRLEECRRNEEIGN